MRDLPAVSGALRPVVLLGHRRSFRGHPGEYHLGGGLRDHPDEIQVQLVAHVFLLDNPLLWLLLGLHVLADHQGRLVLLCALLAIAGGLGVPCVIGGGGVRGAVTLEAPDGLAVGLLGLLLGGGGRVLAGLLDEAVVTVGAVRLVDVVPRRDEHVARGGGGPPRAVPSTEHVRREQGVGCGLVQKRVLVIAAS